jgi:hypothetical protein
MTACCVTYFVELQLLKLQFHKIIIKNTQTLFIRVQNKTCSTLYSLLQAVCFCGCIYNVQYIRTLLYECIGTECGHIEYTQ